MSRKRKDPSEEFEDGRPWNEERWEAFMKESDLRSARFGELLETLHDDPDHEVKIAREMGWDHLADALEEEQDADAADQTWRPDEEDNEADDEADAAPPARRSRRIPAAEDEPAADASSSGAEDNEPGETDDDDPFPDDEDDPKMIPAYQVASRIGMKLHDAVHPFAKPYLPPEGQDEFNNADDEDIVRLIGKAGIGCHIAAAKIAGGHAMGYEDDVLCANIVNCRRGLEGVTEALEALQELKDRKVVPTPLADELMRDAGEVKQAVEERIAELRKRVWWS